MPDPDAPARSFAAYLTGDGKDNLLFTYHDSSVWVGRSVDDRFVFEGWGDLYDWGWNLNSVSPSRLFVDTGDGKDEHSDHQRSTHGSVCAFRLVA